MLEEYDFELFTATQRGLLLENVSTPDMTDIKENQYSKTYNIHMKLYKAVLQELLGYVFPTMLF